MQNLNRKKWSVMFGICLLVSTLNGCSFVKTESRSENEAEITLGVDEETEEKDVPKSDFSRGDLLTMFEEVNNEYLISFLYNDYNKDGVHEAFVITKDDDYSLWYVSGDGCEQIRTRLANVRELETDLLCYRTKDYLMIQYETKGVPYTLVYSVDNNNMIYEPDISGCGYLEQDEGKGLELRIYNGNSESDYCTYYLHYLMDDGFREYGAIPISKEQFLEFDGAAEILDRLKQHYADCQVEYSFLYRSNYYININISRVEDGTIKYEHATVSYDTKAVELVDEKPRNGKEEIAYMLRLATFPTEFKHPVQKENTKK